MFSAFIWSLPFLFMGEPDGQVCYLYHPVENSPAGAWTEPYYPAEGDVIFYDHRTRFWKVVDAIAGTEPPDHAGIVVTRPDGRLAVLESAPDSVLKVFLLDVGPRLQEFDGTIWVRRLRCPLTPEQSASLTDFALRQEGKGYAPVRLVLQLTPFHSRGKVRSKIAGATYLDRRRWICSELVVAAGAVCGLFDPHAILANTVYPRDILDDRTYDLSPRYEPAAYWVSQPPEPEMQPVTGGQHPGGAVQVQR